MNTNEEIQRLAEEQMAVQLEQFDAVQEEEQKKILLQEEEEKKLEEQEKLEEKQQKISEIESMQDENGQFNIDQVTKILYEIEYWKELSKENIDEQKDAKNNINTYLSEYYEADKIYFNIAEEIKMLSEELNNIIDKQKKLDGKISNKNQIRKFELEKKIDELKNEQIQQKNKRIETKKNFLEAKKIFKELQKEEEKDFIQRNFDKYKTQIADIFDYCLTKIKNINFDLNDIDKKIQNSQNQEQASKYFFEYVELYEEKNKFYDNYQEILNLIKNSSIYDIIKIELENIELNLDKQLTNNNMTFIPLSQTKVVDEEEEKKIENFDDETTLINNEQSERTITKEEIKNILNNINDDSEKIEQINELDNIEDKKNDNITNSDIITKKEIIENLSNYMNNPRFEDSEKKIWSEVEKKLLETLDNNIEEFEVKKINDMINSFYTKIKESKLNNIDTEVTETNEDINENNNDDLKSATSNDYWERMYPGYKENNKSTKIYQNKMSLEQIANVGPLFIDESRIDSNHSWMTYQNAKNLSKLSEPQENKINKKIGEVEQEKSILKRAKEKIINQFNENSSSFMNNNSTIIRIKDASEELINKIKNRNTQSITR